MVQGKSQTKPDDAARSADASAAGAPAHALPMGTAATAAIPTAPASKSDAKREAAAKPDASAKAAAPAAPDTAAKAPEKPAGLAVPSQTAPDADAAPAEGTLIGGLDADERIRASTANSERTLWTSAIIVTLLYSSLIASQVLLGDPILQAAQEQERERQRRGQDAPPSISVEIVPDPDKTSKTPHWQEGQSQQTPTPNQQPPQPQQQASIAQPEVPEVEQKQDEQKDEKRPEDAPMLLDIDSLVDAAAQDLKRQIDHAFAKKPQKERREQQAMISGGGMQVRGTGASGKSDAFSRSVIAALMKTRPGPFALWGRVLVSFQVSPSGTLNYVHLLRSSGNAALDKAAVNAIHKARFTVPPPGLTADERTYIIDYIFG